jgi:alkylhydroperoxidase family enzyme
MLKIRRRQMDLLDAIAFERFVKRAALEAATWREASLDGLAPEELHAWAHVRVRRAMDLGLEDERALLAWLEVAAHHGDALAEDAYVLHQLADGDAVADWERTRALIDAMAEGDYAQAEDSA